MCLILFAQHAHHDYPLVFAANRDEFFERPALPAAFWEDTPQVLAGRDQRAGGTWMGVTRSGRWAAVTNYRDPARERRAGRSRGHLVGEYLQGDDGPAAYLQRVAARSAEYNGFNLLVGDTQRVFYYASHGGGAPREVEPGVHGLSNHLLDTPWPKVERGKRALRGLLASAEPISPDSLLEVLYDTEVAPDELLPDTGLARDLERLASAPFIVSPDYGTRASTVLLVEAGGTAAFVERTYLPGPVRGGEVRYEFSLAGQVP